MPFQSLRNFTLFAVVLVLSGAPSHAQQQPQMLPAQVEIAEAEARLMAPEMQVPGTVISLNDSRISTEVEGALVSVAQVGTFVKKDDILARIDDRLLKIALRRTEANLASLKADLTYRDADVVRFGELAESNNASKARLQEVIARREMLVQDIKEAEALLDRANGDFERASIRAPFSGYVAARLASTGEFLSVGAEVVRLVDTENIEITLAAPIAVMPFLEEGALITVNNGKASRQLPVRTIVPVGDSVSRMVEVRLSANADSWVIGASVKIQLPKDKAVQAVAVPRDALILKAGTAYIFKVGADMKAEQVPADIVATVGLWIGIASGIAPGDKVVIRGGERLQPGQSVAIKAS